MPVNYKILDLEKQDRTHDPFSTEPTWLDTFADALARHPIVIFFTNGGMEESFGEKMGNLLAKHVDKGNAVIIGAFANGPKGNTLLPLLFLSPPPPANSKPDWVFF